MNERSMRMKLEEEYTQNTKNHEEEVQLRLKFEAKLNSMHSAYRELNTKNVRTEKDLVIAVEAKVKAEKEVVKLNARVTEQQKELVSQKT